MSNRAVMTVITAAGLALFTAFLVMIAGGMLTSGMNTNIPDVSVQRDEWGHKYQTLDERCKATSLKWSEKCADL